MTNLKGRSAAVLLVAVAAVLVFPAAALANVGASGSMSVTTISTTVDSPGHFGTLRVTNTNTPPQNLDSNTVTQLQVALSCGAVRLNENLCPVPDVGAIETSTVATGESGGACAGRTFNVTGPDASGVYTFTVVGAPVVLAPGATCGVVFPMYFRRVPLVDSNPGLAGVQTRVNGRARLNHPPSGLTVTSYPSLEITIIAPAGGNGVADFNGDGLTDPSVYRNGAWHVQNQTVVFHGLPSDIPVPADYDGNGTTDRVVFRDGAWYTHTKPTVFFGLAGDIPVPADYDGNGTVDRAVYRNGAWYVDLPGGTNVTYFGLPGDIPVPGNYDNDAAAERAVYRDGAWFVEGQQTVYLGLPGDIPVPADYNGDGDLERAVYRNGAWYREGLSTVFFGLAGDVPVPGDYNNDNFADMGVFRDGAWYVAGFNPVYHGLEGDIPLPLPQAVYREFF